MKTLKISVEAQGKCFCVDYMSTYDCFEVVGDFVSLLRMAGWSDGDLRAALRECFGEEGDE